MVTLNGITSEQVADILTAYEPVWAIGVEGKPAEADYVDKIYSHIRSTLVDLYGDEGKSIPILYGGIVHQNIFMSYLTNQDVNGLFIGRAA